MTADELRAALKELDMTQALFAEALGVHPATVKRWVNDDWPVPKYAGLVASLLTAQKSPRKPVQRRKGSAATTP